MPSYDKDNPMRIHSGVIPMDSHGALVRCKVYMALGETALTFVVDAYDRVDQDDCLEYCFLVPEFDCEGYTITKVEILRSVQIGAKLVEHVCARTGPDFEFTAEMGEPSAIVFQDEKLKA